MTANEMGRWIAALGAIGLVGCAHRVVRPADRSANQGAASWHAVEPAGTAHYPLALGEVSSGATPMQRVTPVYPPSMLQACPPAVDIIAQMIVDTRGRVIEVRPADATSRTPAMQPFLAATRAAAMRWVFNPLQVNHWSADAQGESHVVDSRTLPFSLDYSFRFSCHAGSAEVSRGDAAMPSSR